MNTLTLNEKVFKILTNIFNSYEEVNEVVLYGSKAKETHNSRSDIDLVVRNSDLNRQNLGKIKQQIDNSDIPYIVDLQIIENIKNNQLIEHIN